MKKNFKLLLNLALILIIVLSISSVFAQDIESTISYEMDIELNEESKSLTAIEVVQFKNTYDTDLNDLVFHLYPDSYGSYETLPSIGRFYTDGETPKLSEEEIGDINIKKVLINDDTVKFTQDNQILKIKLPKPLKKNDDVKVIIEFELKIPKSINRLGYFESIISLTNWYPILSVFDPETNKWDENPYYPVGESNFSEIADYNVNISVPNNMKVVSTGKIIKETNSNNNSKIVSIEAKNVRDFVLFMSPDYEVLSTEVDGIKINSYYLAVDNGEKKKTAQILMNEVANTVKFFNETIGKYPYDELDIIETRLSGGAMEYPQVIQMGSFYPLGEDYKDNNRVPFIIEAAVHEAIHQWWYVGVGNNEFKEPVMDEGLTVFTTAYYFEKNYGEYHYNAPIMKIRNRIYPEKHLPINSSVSDFNDWGEYVRLIYGKAPILFEDLRHQVGEEKFIEILKEYYNKYLFKNGSIEGFLEVIEQISGKEVRIYFEEAFSTEEYFPQHLQLSEEERLIVRRESLKSEILQREKTNGISIGSILLRGLQEEKIYIVKPSNTTDKDKEVIEFLLENMKVSLENEYGIELVIKEDNQMTTEEISNNNLILLGNPKNNSIIEEMSNEFPISITSDKIELEDISINSKNVSGTFISKNKNNEDKLVLVIFWSDVHDNLKLNMMHMRSYYIKYNLNINGKIEIKGQ